MTRMAWIGRAPAPNGFQSTRGAYQEKDRPKDQAKRADHALCGPNLPAPAGRHRALSRYGGSFLNELRTIAIACSTNASAASLDPLTLVALPSALAGSLLAIEDVA